MAVQLNAVRFPLDPGPDIDPFALAGADGLLFHYGGRTLVGRGAALVIDLPGGLDDSASVSRATDLLAALPCDDRVGGATNGVIGFTSLPFVRSEPGVLTVPSMLYGREPDGTEWVTYVEDDTSALPTSAVGHRSMLHRSMLQRSAVASQTTDSVEVHITPLSTDQEFASMVEDALTEIDSGAVTKVVLARQADVSLGGPVDVGALLGRWRELEPSCALFSLPLPDGRFVGASPELLVERTGTQVHCRPLAGTTDRTPGEGGGVLPRELLSSDKDGREHRLVVEAIGSALRPLCSNLEIPSGPDLVHLHTITHLGTSIEGTLVIDDSGRPPTVLRLVADLHPTPAVGGVPAEPAVELIGRLEPQAREHYAGPVGVIDGRGDGTFVVGIRSMSIHDDQVRLAAGVGIVAGSNPDTELAETNLKFSAVMDALSPGTVFTTREGTVSSTVTAG